MRALVSPAADYPHPGDDTGLNRRTPAGARRSKADVPRSRCYRPSGASADLPAAPRNVSTPSDRPGRGPRGQAGAEHPLGLPSLVPSTRITPEEAGGLTHVSGI